MSYWTDNNLVKPQQVVVCAANKYGDLIIPSARHHDKVMNKLIKTIGGLRPINCEQGFIDQFGDFLTRKEAMLIAKDSGQPLDVTRCDSNTSELFSEGLY